MRWLVLFVALTLSTPAFAQSSKPDGAQAGTSPPSGRVDNCDAWLPATHADAVTMLVVLVSPTGDVLASRIMQGSGDANLDTAALACSRHMFIAPATAAGQQSQVTWLLAVHWRTKGHAAYFVPSVREDESRCRYPEGAVRANITGTTLLSLQIGPDGKVQSASVAKSSGASVLDDASTACASVMRFPPAMINGQPVAIEWQHPVVWALSNVRPRDPHGQMTCWIEEPGYCNDGYSPRYGVP